MCLNAADLDTAFGTGGVAYLNGIIPGGSDHAETVLLQPDGKILVTGETGYSSYSGSGNYIGQGQLILARYNPDGSLDKTFDEDGKLILPALGGPSSSILQADGKILVTCGVTSGYMLFRLNPDGSRDATFGTNGMIYDTTHFNFLGTGGMTVQSDGRIILVGNYELDPYLHTMGAMRLNGDGTIDTSFGNAGFVSVNFDPNGTGGISDYVHARSVVVQPDGDIVLAGEPASAATPNLHQLDLARLNPDGSLDTSFGTSGMIAIQNIGGGENVILGADGSILVPGIL